MNKQDLIELLKEKVTDSQRRMESSKQAGTNSSGFSYDLGYFDALSELLEELESD